MDQLSGFNLDNIPEQSSLSRQSEGRTVTTDESPFGTSPSARQTDIQTSQTNGSPLSNRRQSHTGSTRPSVAKTGNRVISGGFEAKGGRNSLVQGMTSPPLRSEYSGRNNIHSLLNQTTNKAAGANKQKPAVAGFKDKLKREQGGIVKRRSGAVLARGYVCSSLSQDRRMPA
jgi:hypothetical protein